MKYLQQFRSKCLSEAQIIDWQLNLRDSEEQKIYDQQQQAINQPGMQVVELFKSLVEGSLSLYCFQLPQLQLYGIILSILFFTNIIEQWVVNKRYLYCDIPRLLHTIVLQCCVVEICLVNEDRETLIYFLGVFQIYSVYISQNLNNKLFLAIYIILSQTYMEVRMIQHLQHSHLRHISSLIVAIIFSFNVYFQERRVKLNFQSQIRQKKDLYYSQQLLNHSLSQYIFVVKLQTLDLSEFLDIPFANEACSKNFSTLGELQTKTAELFTQDGYDLLVHISNQSVSKMNATVDPFFDKILRQSNDEGILFNRNITLQQFLINYITLIKNNPSSSQEIKLNCQSEYQSRKYDVLVDCCQWRGELALFVSISDLSDKLRILELEKQDQYKDLVLASVSHDLKNPIGSIQQTIQYVTDQLNSNAGDSQTLKDCCNYLNMCKSNSIMLQSFVNDLQDFSQIKQQKLKLNIQEFDLKDLLNEIDQVFHFQFNMKQITFDTCATLRTTNCINDPIRIKQILFNLISNSLKFTSRGNISLTITDEMREVMEFELNLKQQVIQNCTTVNLVAFTKNKAKLLLCTVNDTGSGMDKKTQKGLFKAFGTYDNDKKMNKNGVGLGLMICKKLCGYIGPLEYVYLKSGIDCGSTFQFVIYKDYQKRNHYDCFGTNDLSICDLAESVEVEWNNNSSPFRAMQIQTPKQSILSTSRKNQLSRFLCDSMNKYSILLVDDEMFNNVSNKMLLTQLGVTQVEIAYSAVEALRKMETTEFDIVFLDINLPGICGITCLQEIRKLNKKIKIYMLSGYSDSDTERMCTKSGANKFIQKPLTQKVLRHLLR